MLGIQKVILEKITHRAEDKSLRKLSLNRGIDFCSNDYLGFAKSDKLHQLIEAEQKLTGRLIGSTGSRLLAGNSQYIEELEKEIAFFHNAEAGLIFNSGYDANVGILSSIPQRGDTIICDELIHASLIDGARLSYANRYTFKHNDISNLEEKLKIAKGNIFIVIESVYSMDGDEAPLLKIIDLAKKYDAEIVLDEAHATGVIGKNGLGLAHELGVEKEIFIRTVTFGKALGSHGAVVLGSEILKQYLINFARSFIYTTSLPYHNLFSIKAAYQLLPNTKALAELHDNIQLFKSLISTLDINYTESRSAIQSIIIGGNEKTKQTAEFLQKKGYDIKAILSPTVALGSERLRICLHSFNTKDEIKNLTTDIDKLVRL